MNSTTPHLRWASRKLRGFQDELARQGTPFQQLPWREGVDLWPRYAAWTHIGCILAEYDGTEWLLSLAVPGARYFAAHVDWTECLQGPARGGYRSSETASVFWVKKLLEHEKVPEVDVDALDRIVEKRYASPGYSKAKVALFWGAVIIGFPLFAWSAFAVDSPIAPGAVGVVAVGILSILGSSWRVHRRRKKLGYTSRQKES